ncbi:MAG: MoxR family ATPase [Nitrospiraceae bacterium]|nr:MoxR family ATPase [Nitrospiraceae bacterium]
MINQSLRQLQSQMETVLQGKGGVIRMAIVALLGRGHLLIEDIPGVGKTTLASALARSMDCSFRRIQFTSDLLPTDILGVTIFNQETKEFEFRQGPVFSNIVLADEINRTNPKTQSALLEAMSEHRITTERTTLVLPEPFMVIATQNPVEYHGTFPLPESQLDRFMLHITIGYPLAEFERRAILRQSSFEILEDLQPVVSRQEIVRMQDEAGTVFAEDSVVDYLMQIVAGTRNHPEIRLGASTRGAQFFLRAARAYAYSDGRDFVLPDDVKALAPLVLGHRIIPRARKSIAESEALIEEIAESLPVPL